MNPDSPRPQAPQSNLNFARLFWLGSLLFIGANLLGIAPSTSGSTVPHKPLDFERIKGMFFVLSAASFVSVFYFKKVCKNSFRASMVVSSICVTPALYAKIVAAYSRDMKDVGPFVLMAVMGAGILLLNWPRSEGIKNE